MSLAPERKDKLLNPPSWVERVAWSHTAGKSTLGSELSHSPAMSA